MANILIRPRILINIMHIKLLGCAAEIFKSSVSWAFSAKNVPGRLL